MPDYEITDDLNPGVPELGAQRPPSASSIQPMHR